jgi:hypothetical protein
MARPASLTPGSNGAYYRQIGYLPSGSQPRLTLGKDKAEALVRNARLEALWVRVKERVGEWDEVTHAMAGAIAAGETRYVIPPNPKMPSTDD